MLSKKDFCASGYKICEALKKDHDIKLVALRHNYSLGHPYDIILNDENRKHVQAIIKESDIIHIKGDWPAGKKYMGFDISEKHVVQTVSGGLFRKKEDRGYEKFLMKSYQSNKLNTAMTPDLCYPEYSNIWTPHPINSDQEEIIWDKKRIPLLLHAVVNKGRRSVKGTDFVMNLFARISSQIHCETRIVTGISYSELLEMKKRCTIYFDQFGVGFYGNSAIEAMQYGIPVCAWISPKAYQQERGKLLGCPVITLPEKNVLSWSEKIINILESDMIYLAMRTKHWCDRIHGYKAVREQWNKLYESIL